MPPNWRHLAKVTDSRHFFFSGFWQLYFPMERLGENFRFLVPKLNIGTWRVNSVSIARHWGRKSDADEVVRKKVISIWRHLATCREKGRPMDHTSKRVNGVVPFENVKRCRFMMFCFACSYIGMVCKTAEWSRVAQSISMGSGWLGVTKFTLHGKTM